MHKGLKARQPRLVRWLDRHIGEKHVACSSIWQKGKREMHITYVDGESILKPKGSPEQKCPKISGEGNP